MIWRLLWKALDRLAGPAPRLGVDLAIIFGALVAFRIVWIAILIATVAVR